jgi:glucose/arabinose dehydrogenase
MPIGRVLVLVLVLVLVALAPGCGAEDAADQTSTPRAQHAPALRIARVAAGLRAPLHLAAPRSERNRLYVVEQEGRIMVIEDGRVRATPFLDIRDRISSGGERGLLSVAFHPSYAQNRRFYVNFTDGNGDTRVVEMRSDGERALLETARELLFVRQPYANHNGGQVAFGRDGRLYVGMGDGGAGGDPENRAQNLGTLLGKLVSINVNRAGAEPQIAASGLRNPWRFSFDRATGDLWIGDVGQSSWEEIDFTARAQLPGLENYGWDVYEGRAVYERKRPSRGTLVFPVHVYGRGQGCTVIGGFVYRGSAVPAARGRYFFGDLCEGTIWSLRRVSGKVRQLRREPFRVPSIASFGEDANGELYLVSLEGAVFRLTS